MDNFESALQLRQTLKSLGLSSNEIKILEILLEWKKGTAQEINKEIGINFSNVQFALATLTSKNLLICHPSPGTNVTFEIAPRKEFLLWIQKEKNKNKEQQKKASDNLDKILSGIEKNTWNLQTERFQGKEEMKNFYHRVVTLAAEQKTNICGWVDYKTIEQIVGIGNKIGYYQWSEEYDVLSRYIVPKDPTILEELENNPDYKFSTNKEKALRKHKEIKLIETLPIDGELRILKYSIAISTGKKNPKGIIIHNELVTNLLRAIFQSFWNQ